MTCSYFVGGNSTRFRNCSFLQKFIFYFRRQDEDWRLQRACRIRHPVHCQPAPVRRHRDIEIPYDDIHHMGHIHILYCIWSLVIGVQDKGLWKQAHYEKWYGFKKLRWLLSPCCCFHPGALLVPFLQCHLVLCPLEYVPMFLGISEDGGTGTIDALCQRSFSIWSFITFLCNRL